MPVTWSVFDLIGPVMIGPSSSHTAGACTLGYMAQAVYGNFKKVDIQLHGSFADVYEGHCTDLALVAGLLRMRPYDFDLRRSFEVAKERGIEFQIIPTNLGSELHPNTVRFIFDDNTDRTIMGSSIGGGKALINYIGKVPLEVSLDHSTILIHTNGRTLLPKKVLDALESIGKEVLKISTGEYKAYTIYAAEVMDWYTPEDLKVFEEMEGVEWVKYVNHLSNYVDIA